MKTLAYYNGNVSEQEDMLIPMNDRVSWFGDGVYDAGPARNYKIFAIDEHVDRFFRNAAWLEIEMPVTKDELKKLLYDLIAKMDSGDQFVYMQVTRGTGIRNHIYTDGPGNLWITMKPVTYPDDTASHKVILCEDDRWMHNDIKSLNLIPAVRNSEKARRAGCDEAVLYRPGGIVTECAHSNVHIMKDGVVITHPADNYILPGIARAHLIRMCGKLGIPVCERPFTVDELLSADEIMISSSSKLVMRIGEVDGKPAGEKDPDTYFRLHEALYEEFIEETK